MDFTLNEQLEQAFYHSQYASCRDLIAQGADKEVIRSAAKNIKPMRRTMSQDRIIIELVEGE